MRHEHAKLDGDIMSVTSYCQLTGRASLTILQKIYNPTARTHRETAFRANGSTSQNDGETRQVWQNYLQRGHKAGGYGTRPPNNTVSTQM